MKMSRKLFLLYVVIILATLGTFAPPIITWALQMAGKNVPSFEILGSTEWVSMISLVVSTYFGSNVWEKHVALSNGVSPNQIDNTIMAIKGSPGSNPIKRQVTIDQKKDVPDEESKRGQQ